MSNEKMLTNRLIISLVESPDEAPKYESSCWTVVVIDKVIIVGNGMESGNPSVDIQLLDNKGNKYLIFATGGTIENLGMAVVGARLRAEGKKGKN